MDEMYGGGSVLTYGKVPCTPVTGAFANYFDVFGDVDQQRVSTGSSVASSTSSCCGVDADELPILVDKRPSTQSASRHTSQILKISSASSLLSSPFLCKSCNKRLVGTRTSRNSGNNNDSFDATSAIQRDPYIVFLQEKQGEVLAALHQEIRTLKHENADLKFQIHVILQQHDSAVGGELLCSYPEKVVGSDTSDNKPSMTMTVCGDREKMLELELDAATKMIQELKWLQQHYENTIGMQESKLDELMKQLDINSNKNTENLKAWPIQIQQPLKIYGPTKATSTNNRPLKSGRQRSSSVHPMCPVNRRNSLQSILPDDYKEQVATLPPINKPINTSLRISTTKLSSPSPVHNKEFDGKVIPKSSRRSSLILTNNNINTPTAFCGEESSQFNN